VLGSVLGPLLFSLLINNITLKIETCRYHVYADDVQLYISCIPSEYATCIDSTNRNLSRIHKWSSLNGLMVNPSKLQAMIVNPAGRPIVQPLGLHMGGFRYGCFEFTDIFVKYFLTVGVMKSDPPAEFIYTILRCNLQFVSSRQDELCTIKGHIFGRNQFFSSHFLAFQTFQLYDK
jgi:hypothetical protein